MMSLTPQSEKSFCGISRLTTRVRLDNMANSKENVCALVNFSVKLLLKHGHADSLTQVLKGDYGLYGR